MTESRQNIVVIGVLLFLAVVVFFMSNPQDIFATTSFIDTDLAKSSGLQVPVKTRMELGTEEHLKQFPVAIGEWTGYDYDTADLKTITGASMTLMRKYNRPTSSQPVNLLIIYTGRASSFRQPVVRYPALDYQVAEEGNDLVYVKDVSWLDRSKDLDVSKLPDWVLKELESTPLSELGYWVSVKKMVIFRKEQENIVDRRVLLYFYIKDREVTPKYGMLSCSAQIPLAGPYDASLQDVKELMGQAIPLLFEPINRSRTILAIVSGRGASGFLAILFLFFIPLSIIAYPVLRTRREQRAKE